MSASDAPRSPRLAAGEDPPPLVWPLYPLFKSLRDVNFYLWTWQRLFILTVFDIVQSVETTTSRVLVLALQSLDALRVRFIPWVKQVVRALSFMQALSIKPALAALAPALGKLETMRANGFLPIITAARQLVSSAGAHLATISEGIRRELDNLRVRLFAIVPTVVAGAGLLAQRLFGLETRAFGGTERLRDKGNDALRWINGIVDRDLLFQPRTLFLTAAAYASGLIALVVNGGILKDPQPDTDQLKTEFPVEDLAKLEPEIKSLAILQRSEVLSAFQLLQSRLE